MGTRYQLLQWTRSSRFVVSLHMLAGDKFKNSSGNGGEVS